MKVCNRCKLKKAEENFYFDKRARDKLSYKCKDCCKELASEWKKKNPEKNRRNASNWRANNLIKSREINKKY